MRPSAPSNIVFHYPINTLLKDLEYLLNVRMSFESDDTDNDNHQLFDHDTSTDDSEYGQTRQNILFQSEKKSSTSQSNSAHNFNDYLEIYERIYAFYSQGEHQQWQSLFSSVLQQSSTPHQTLYLFLDHTLSTANNKKHKMILPLIEQFKQMHFSNATAPLDETIKRNILSTLCRRCAFSQLESITDIFQLHALENQALAIDFINEQLEQQQHDIVFISHLTKILKLLEIDSLPLAKIIILLILKSQWETVRFVIGDNPNLQKTFLHTLDQLISPDKISLRRLFSDYSIGTNPNLLDAHSLKRAARKFLKQYQLNLQDFPNLALHEKISFLKTLFVRKYLERSKDNDDNQSWNEQIKDLIQTNRDLQIKLVDLFVDYTDIEAAVEWTRFYNLDDVEIPEQVNLRRQEILAGTVPYEPIIPKPSAWSTQQSENDIYKPAVLPADIVYIEMDSDVDGFLHRLECSRCDVGSHLPFVGFDCETFMDPTQRTLSSQIVSIIQLATTYPQRNQSFYGVFDMLALRLQFDMKTLAGFAQRIFCSHDFILLTYNYAGDTSSLIENYPSMSEALMHGAAVIDLFRIQQYILEHHPEIFPYRNLSSTSRTRGLSELVRLCFGKPLDKSLQTSDWRKRPLKQAQLIYSVLDARILVDIALLIEERTRSLQIPWSWSDFKGYTWTNKAFKKRTGMNQPSGNSS